MPSFPSPYLRDILIPFPVHPHILINHFCSSLHICLPLYLQLHALTYLYLLNIQLLYHLHICLSPPILLFLHPPHATLSIYLTLPLPHTSCLSQHLPHFQSYKNQPQIIIYVSVLFLLVFVSFLWNCGIGRKILINIEVVKLCNKKLFHLIMALWWNKYGTMVQIIHTSSYGEMAKHSGEMVRRWNCVGKTPLYPYGEMVKRIWCNGEDNTHKST